MIELLHERFIQLSSSDILLIPSVIVLKMITSRMKSVVILFPTLSKYRTYRHR